MCKYCDKTDGNALKVDTLSADGFSYNQAYIEYRKVPLQGKFVPEYVWCMVVVSSYMANVCTTVTPIDFCPYCGRQLRSDP